MNKAEQQLIADIVLFLTTRAVREQIERVLKLKLLGCVLRNAQGNAQFREKLSAGLGLSEGALASELDGSRPFEHPLLVKAFCLGIGKWLLNYMLAAQPRLKVRMLQSFCYSVQQELAPDMLSLAFWCEPLAEPRVDPAGVSRANPSQSTPPPPSEPELAMSVLDEVGRIRNVDEVLSRDSALKEKTIEQCATLLASARYDQAAYRPWARSE